MELFWVISNETISVMILSPAHSRSSKILSEKALFLPLFQVYEIEKENVKGERVVILKIKFYNWPDSDEIDESCCWIVAIRMLITYGVRLSAAHVFEE